MCPNNIKKCLLRAFESQYAFIASKNYMKQEIQTNFKDSQGNPLLELAKEDFFTSDI